MKIITTNKHAYHDYQIDQTREAGIVLTGQEVKSLRIHRADIGKSIVKINKGVCSLTNLDIRLYTKTSTAVVSGYDPTHMRTLLLHKSQLAKIQSKIDQGWCQLIALELYFDIHRRVKVKIGLGRLLKKVEKKQILKEKDLDRQAQREIVSYSRHRGRDD